MNNLREWLVKSVLVRANYRDTKIADLEESSNKWEKIVRDNLCNKCFKKLGSYPGQCAGCTDWFCSGCYCKFPMNDDDERCCDDCVQGRCELCNCLSKDTFVCHACDVLVCDVCCISVCICENANVYCSEKCMALCDDAENPECPCWTNL